MRPSILLLDEPTAGLDPAGEQTLLQLLASLCRERERTLVIATHAIDLVPHLADRVLVLGDGRVLADGTPREVFARADDLERARLRPPLIAQLGQALGRGLPLTLEEAKATWTSL
jgi:cobalt/nickel transport system ATP-binding protein